MTDPKPDRAAPLGDLGPGTRQRHQLRFRALDIAWTALFTVLLLWGVTAAVGALRGDTTWAYSVVAGVLLAGALGLRLTLPRRQIRE
ncbi:hypothetical protein ACFV3O_13920 [Streptomyces albidoflavus]|uniref:hypothetical protein n=1 Tax=Streptomyces albidoflavus TaxID=1886 RepID=UPI0033DD28A1